MGKGIGRRRTYFTRESWRERVNPAFVSYWSATKKMRLAGKIPNQIELNTEWQLGYQALASAGRLLREEIAKSPNPIFPQVWAKIVAGLDGEREIIPTEPGVGYAQSIESGSVFRMLVFLKFGLTYRNLITSIDLDHSVEAHTKFQQVHQDMIRFESDGFNFDGLKLRFHYHHFTLMVQGFDLGILSLNEEELAKCFDAICPCNNKKHSAPYLKRQRREFRKAVAQLLDDGSKTYRTI
jgi:hypothetical protein